MEQVCDEVVVKRIIARRGRASAKVIATIRESVKFDIVYINQNEIGEIEAGEFEELGFL